MPKTYRNRAYYSGAPVYWYTPTPDSAGTYYPGGGTWGVDVYDFATQEISQDNAVLSVRDFGATGDGSTDDTTAFQNAITYSGTGGYTIYIPPGDYLIDTELDITWTSPGAFIGAGQNATNLIINGNVTNFLDFNVSYAYVGNFSIYGSANTRSNRVFWDNTVSAAIKLTNFDFSTLKDIEFVGVTGKAVYAYNVESSKVENLSIDRCGDTSNSIIDIDDGSVLRSEFTNILFSDGFSNTSPVFYSDTANNCKFSDLKFNQTEDVFLEVTLTGAGTPFTNGENCTITGGITGKVRTHNTLSGASPVVIVYNLSALTFVVTDTLTGVTSGSTATIDAIRWCRGTDFTLDDFGYHTVDGIEIINGQNNASGKEAIQLVSDAINISNITLTGDFPSGGITSVGDYVKISNVLAYGFGDGSTAKLLDISGSHVNITGVTSVNWAEIEFDASYGVLSDVTMEPNGVADAVALDVGGSFNVFHNIVIQGEGTPTGVAADINSDLSLVSKLVVNNFTAASDGIYVNTSSDRLILSDCVASNITAGNGIRIAGEETIVEGCYISNVGGHGITCTGGGAEQRPSRISDNIIDTIGVAGASTYSSIMLADVQAASANKGLILSGNKFIKGYTTPLYDIYLDNVWQNVTIINNNATEGFGTSSLGTGTGKVIAGNKGITTSEILAGSSLALSTGAAVMTGTGDPGSGGGTAATQGSVFMRTDGGTGTTFYVKDGAADTDWGAAGGGLVLSSTPNTTTTSGIGEDNLTSVTLPQNSHSSYTILKIEAAGTTTGTNDNKTIKFYYGATSITIHPAVNRAGDWQFEGRIALKAATDARCKWNCFHESTTHGYTAFSDDLSAGDITLKFTGECANAGDTVTQTMFIATLG